MKKSLVAGGAGFIGSHLCDRLIKAGHFVYCLDNLYSGSLLNIKPLQDHHNFIFIHSDVSLPCDLEVQEIYNLACPASPVHYQANPIYTVNTSIQGATRLAILAQKLKAKMFHASTSEIYGEAMVHPQPENYWGNVNPIGPRACYDESKRLAETILMIHYHQQPFPLKIGRIFNTYGPRMHIHDGRVVSNFIVQALNAKDLTVYGNGSQTRSFCYVDDLVDAIIKFMNTENSVVGPINLGNDVENSVLELAQLIIKLTGTSAKVISAPLPVDDPTHRKPDITLARELLGWEPKVSLEEGLKKSVEFYKDYLQKYPLES